MNENTIEDVDFARKVWKTLSKIDVNDKTDQRGKFTYLSWSWAWGTMMANYPQFKFRFGKNELHDGGTVTVSVTCSIDNVTHDMWLPVMDHRNDAICDPDARVISDAKMRCLVKCMALFGLGYYIYAGEDVPTEVVAKVVSDQPLEMSVERVEQLAKTKPTLEVFIDGGTLGDGTVVEACTDIDELKKYWTDNRDALKTLEAEVPSAFADVLVKFKDRSATIVAAIKGDEG